MSELDACVVVVWMIQCVEALELHYTFKCRPISNYFIRLNFIASIASNPRLVVVIPS